MSLYGKFNFSGKHENDPEPIKNVYYPERKAYLNDIEEKIYS